MDHSTEVGHSNSHPHRSFKPRSHRRTSIAHAMNMSRKPFQALLTSFIMDTFLLATVASGTSVGLIWIGKEYLWYFVRDHAKNGAVWFLEGQVRQIFQPLQRAKWKGGGGCTEVRGCVVYIPNVSPPHSPCYPSLTSPSSQNLTIVPLNGRYFEEMHVEPFDMPETD